MKRLICLVKLSDLQCMITKYVRLCNCMQSLHLICLYACIRKNYFKYIGSTSGLGFGSPRSKASLIFTVYSDINRHSRLNMFKAFPYSKVKYVQGFQGKFWATLMLSCVYIIHKIIWSWILYYTVLCKFGPLIPTALIPNVSHPTTLLGTHTMVFSSTSDGTVGERITSQYGWCCSSTKLPRKAIHQPWINIASQFILQYILTKGTDKNHGYLFSSSLLAPKLNNHVLSQHF